MTKVIVERGKFQIDCKTCKTTFIYEYCDTSEFRDRDYTGSTDVYRVVYCPVCENIVIHKP
jgi:hypothetical protein